MAVPADAYELTPSERRRLLAVAARVVGSNDAEDVVQEALIKAYLHRDQNTGQAPWLHWMFTITINSARSAWRAYNRRPLNQRAASLQGFETDESLSYTMDERLLRRRVVEALRCVPKLHERRALFIALTTSNERDAADQAGCSVPAYRQRLFRARRIFKQHWQKAQV
jgi:DNA-directed RNA polymerase specialized sigma24 family protein